MMNLQVRNLQKRPVDAEPLARIAEIILTQETRQLDELSLVFVDDERMQEINLAYRGFDKPTDVISFEAETDAEGGTTGEIIISMPTVERQAATEGHGAQYEIAWLFAHGLLHVLGYDDDTEDNLELMKSQQRLALETAGIARE